MPPSKVLKFAIECGEIMLRCGAETNRVEDTMIRILEKYNYNSVDVFATTTGIFGSIVDLDDTIFTMVKRITNRSINLEKVSLVNNLSRNFVASKIDLDEAISELTFIVNKAPYANIYKYFASAISCASFSFMFGGSFEDSAAAFITGFILYVCLTKLSAGNLSNSISTILGGMVVVSVILVLSALGLGNNIDKAIIGSIMPMVPGLGITNAVRDIMNADYISGTSRIADALLVAICIATGVGIALSVGIYFRGELLIWL